MENQEENSGGGGKKAIEKIAGGGMKKTIIKLVMAYNALTYFLIIFFGIVVIFSVFPSSTPAGENTGNGGNYAFPVDAAANYNYTDTWGGARAGMPDGHEGTDIFGPKHTPLLAVTDGKIGSSFGSSGRGGFRLHINGNDGTNYYYAHLDNDTAGTDDGAGGAGTAFAPGIAPGVVVTKGQVIGYLGDSGEAESTQGGNETLGQLHFGMYKQSYSSSNMINPYPYLRCWDTKVPTDQKPTDPAVCPKDNAGGGGGGQTNPGGFAWPGPGIVTSEFGMRFHPIQRKWKLHAGIDINAKTGDSVTASKGGNVSIQSTSQSGGYGNLVIIDHGGGQQTYYAHNSSFTVTSGNVVQGQEVAKAGATGGVTGPHIHFEIRINGVPKNPRDYLAPPR